MSQSEFAKQQLKKHGWTEGSGLGKQEDGRCEPIKVSLKMDKAGVGHDPGKEFTDHWWLRVFNEAAQKTGKKQQNSTSNEDGELKQKKATECKNNLYKNFVKSSTLTNGIEEKNSHSDSSSEDSSDNENNTSALTLNDIHKFCGGATGHKAARFGIKMGGKLARIAKHDKMFEERLQKEKLLLDVSTTDICANNSLPDTVGQKSPLLNSRSLPDKQTPCEIIGDKRKKKHKKHKKDKYSQDADDGCFSEELTDGLSVRVDDVVSEIVSKANKTKKHKKKKYNEDNNQVEDSEVELSRSNETLHLVKKKKQKSISEGAVCDNVPEINRSEIKKNEENISCNELLDESEKKRKKKKKTEENISCNELLDESEKKRKKKKTEENISCNELLDESEKKRKKKKTKENISCNELLDESEKKKKKKTEENIPCNELLDESEKKRKKKKTEENISCNELLDESEKKKKKKNEENIPCNELLDESEKKRKKKKTEENISCNELLDESEKKKKKKTEENIPCNGLLDESEKKRKKKTEENISCNELLDESVRNNLKATEKTMGSNGLFEEPDCSRKKKRKKHNKV